MLIGVTNTGQLVIMSSVSVEVHGKCSKGALRNCFPSLDCFWEELTMDLDAYECLLH